MITLQSNVNNNETDTLQSLIITTVNSTTTRRAEKARWGGVFYHFIIHYIMVSSRFYKSNESDVRTYHERSNNKNTSKSTRNWINVFKSWGKERGFSQKMEQYVPEDLDSILGKFYTELRKVDGTEYEPNCLRVMLGALERHLRNHHYPASIINGVEFLNSRKVLDGKVRSLREQGKGKKPNKARPLTHDDEEVLWMHGQIAILANQKYFIPLLLLALILKTSFRRM